MKVERSPHDIIVLVRAKAMQGYSNDTVVHFCKRWFVESAM